MRKIWVYDRYIKIRLYSDHTGNSVNNAGQNVLVQHSHHFWRGP